MGGGSCEVQIKLTKKKALNKAITNQDETKKIVLLYFN